MASDAVTRYSTMACGALLTYDVLCTLDEEVAYVWLSPWSFGKCLYFGNRYLPFVAIFGKIHLATQHNTISQCRFENPFFTWVMLLGVMLSEIILMMRTCAIWNRRRSIVITFWILGLSVSIANIILNYYAIASVEYKEVSSYITGCADKHYRGELVSASFIILVFTETTIVVLTMIKAVEHLRDSRSNWVSKMYTDGLVFYLYTLALSLTNVFTILFLKSWLYLLQSVFHSIFCSRVLLLILRQHHSHSDTLDSTSLGYTNPTSIHPETESDLSTENHYNGDSIALLNIVGQTASDITGRPSFNVVLPTTYSDRDIP